MKRELTLTDIAGYLPHNLNMIFHDGDIWGIDATLGEVDYDNRLLPLFHFTSMKAILRPMSDLYVEITERGYNDGKPFVPIMELANLLGDADSIQWAFQPENSRVFSREYSWCFQWDFECRAFVLPDSPSEYAFGHILPCTHKLYDLLHRLHFDYRGLIDDGPAINVHDLPKNPYES